MTGLVYATLFVLSAPAIDTVVVALDGLADDVASLGAVAEARGQLGERVISIELARVTLLGTDSPQPGEESLRALLQRARKLQAGFDTPGAMALWNQVVYEFDHALWQSSALRQLAADAAHDMISSLLAEGLKKEARETAGKMLVRFGDVGVDEQRHPPSVVEFLRRQLRGLEVARHATLHLTSDAPGTVYANGRSMGTIRDTLTLVLPVGSHRLWIETGDGASFPHTVDLRPAGRKLDVKTAFESRVWFGRVLTLRCGGDCEGTMREVMRRLDADRVVGVAKPGDHAQSTKLVIVSRGETGVHYSELAGSGQRSLAEPAHAPRPLELSLPQGSAVVGFSFWSLAPFGVGQWSQRRYGMATVFGLAELTLGGLNAYWWLEQQQRDDDASVSLAARGEAADQANLYAGLFWGTLLVGIAEAVLVEVTAD